jgi:hypothetical protein
MLIRMVAIVLTLLSWSAFAVDGTNLPGHDYANFDAPSAFVCRTTCGASPVAKPIHGSNLESRVRADAAGLSTRCLKS